MNTKALNAKWLAIVFIFVCALAIVIAVSSDASAVPDDYARLTMEPVNTETGVYRIVMSASASVGVSRLDLKMSYDNTKVQPVTQATAETDEPARRVPADGSTSTAFFRNLYPSYDYEDEPRTFTFAPGKWLVHGTRTAFDFMTYAAPGTTAGLDHTAAEVDVAAFYFALVGETTLADLDKYTFIVEEEWSAGEDNSVYTDDSFLYHFFLGNDSSGKVSPLYIGRGDDSGELFYGWKDNEDTLNLFKGEAVIDEYNEFWTRQNLASFELSANDGTDAVTAITVPETGGIDTYIVADAEDVIGNAMDVFPADAVWTAEYKSNEVEAVYGELPTGIAFDDATDPATLTVSAGAPEGKVQITIANPAGTITDSIELTIQHDTVLSITISAPGTEPSAVPTAAQQESVFQYSATTTWDVAGTKAFAGEWKIYLENNITPGISSDDTLNPTGVSIDSTGKLTILPTAAAGTYYVFAAEGDQTAVTAFTLTKDGAGEPFSLEILGFNLAGETSVTYPVNNNGVVTLDVPAKTDFDTNASTFYNVYFTLKDKYGENVTISAPETYINTLDNAITGVSQSGSDRVAVTSAALTNTTSAGTFTVAYSADGTNPSTTVNDTVTLRTQRATAVPKFVRVCNTETYSAGAEIAATVAAPLELPKRTKSDDYSFATTLYAFAFDQYGDAMTTLPSGYTWGRTPGAGFYLPSQSPFVTGTVTNTPNLTKLAANLNTPVGTTNYIDLQVKQGETAVASYTVNVKAVKAANIAPTLTSAPTTLTIPDMYTATGAAADAATAVATLTLAGTTFPSDKGITNYAYTWGEVAYYQSGATLNGNGSVSGTLLTATPDNAVGLVATADTNSPTLTINNATADEFDVVVSCTITATGETVNAIIPVRKATPAFKFIKVVAGSNSPTATSTHISSATLVIPPSGTSEFYFNVGAFDQYGNKFGEGNMSYMWEEVDSVYSPTNSSLYNISLDSNSSPRAFTLRITPSYSSTAQTAAIRDLAITISKVQGNWTGIAAKTDFTFGQPLESALTGVTLGTGTMTVANPAGGADLTLNGTYSMSTDADCLGTTTKYPEAGATTVTLSFTISGGDYDGVVLTKDFNVNVAKKYMASSMFTIDPASYTYTGSAITPDYTASDGTGTVNLLQASDYTASFRYNTNVTTTEDKAELVIVPTAGSNYMLRGTAVNIIKYFDITPKSIAVTTPTDGYTVDPVAAVAYSGDAKTPTVVFKDLRGAEADYTMVAAANNTTPADGDYYLSWSNNVNAGTTAVITIHGRGNYSGTRTVNFTINPLDLTETAAAIAAIPAQTYTGSGITPTPEVSYGGSALTAGTETSGDYYLTYSNNTNVGTNTATVTANFRGNYTGSKSATFSIVPKELNAGNATVNVTGTYVYTGSAIKPTTVTVMDQNRNVALTPATNNTNPTDGDFYLTYGANVNAGTNAGSVTVNLRGNYSGTLTVNFRIDPKSIATLGGFTTTVNGTHTFTGAAIEPTVTLEDNARNIALTPATNNANPTDGDYYLTYSNNINASNTQPTITINGRGNYTGTRTVNFEIDEKSIADASVKVSDIPNQTYTGSAITPALTIIDERGTGAADDYTLREFVSTSGDYSLTFNANTNVGQASITIVGAGNYTGTRTVNFNIVAAQPDFSFSNLSQKLDSKQDGANLREVTATFTPADANADMELVYFDADGNGYQNFADFIAAITDANGKVTPGDYDVIAFVTYANPSDPANLLAGVDNLEQATLSIKKYTKPAVSSDELTVTGSKGKATVDADKLDGIKELTVVIPLAGNETARLIFDKDALDRLDIDDDMVVSVEEADKQVNGYDVLNAYTVTIKVDGKTVDDLGKAKVMAYLPVDLGNNNRSDVVALMVNSNDASKISGAFYSTSLDSVIFYLSGDIADYYVMGIADENVIVVNQFYDVPAKLWSAEYIYYLADLGIVDGMGGNMFYPNANVTRAQFVKMIAGIAGADVSRYASATFTDVPASAWFAPYVAWAEEVGIVMGVTETTFAPDQFITREQIATMIYRYVNNSNFHLPSVEEPIVFADAASFSAYAVEAIGAMQQAGIIDGMPDGNFAPKDFTTRGQACKLAALVHQMMNK